MNCCCLDSCLAQYSAAKHATLWCLQELYIVQHHEALNKSKTWSVWHIQPHISQETIFAWRTVEILHLISLTGFHRVSIIQRQLKKKKKMLGTKYWQELKGRFINPQLQTRHESLTATLSLRLVIPLTCKGEEELRCSGRTVWYLHNSKKQCPTQQQFGGKLRSSVSTPTCYLHQGIT